MARIPYNSPFNPYVPPWPKRQPEQWVNLGGNLGYARIGPPVTILPTPESLIPPRLPVRQNALY